ncbi:MAG: LysR family transcriptional regulator [Hyphomicrobiales bacterium]|nr:LysR family transcriptional regulator [Hyphomicrobiales bacterium]
MDLRHARTFVTVAELGTVSKAALRLRIAQPALSRQIADFERELGLRLFDRVGRRLRMTSEGEQLLGDCRDLLDRAGAVGQRAQLLRRGDTGVLRVAASPQFIESVIAGFLDRYTQRFPDVRVRLFEAVGLDNLAMLERGDIHLGQNLLQTVADDDPRFGRYPLAAVDLLAAGDRSQNLGHRNSMEIERLAPYPLLLLEGGFSVRRTFDAACRLAGFKPVIAFESRAPQTLLALARARYGVAIIPSTLQTDPRGLQIARLTYRGRTVGEPLTLLWDRRRPLPRYAAAFCELCAAHARAILPITRPTSAAGRRPPAIRTSAR